MTVYLIKDHLRQFRVELDEHPHWRLRDLGSVFVLDGVGGAHGLAPVAVLQDGADNVPGVKIKIKSFFMFSAILRIFSLMETFSGNI